MNANNQNSATSQCMYEEFDDYDYEEYVDYDYEEYDDYENHYDYADHDNKKSKTKLCPKLIEISRKGIVDSVYKHMLKQMIRKSCGCLTIDDCDFKKIDILSLPQILKKEIKDGLISRIADEMCWDPY